MDNDRLNRLEQVLDRQDIMDCLTRICRGSDRCDRELFLSAFHDDAIVAVGPFVGGPAELYDWSAALQGEAYKATFHNMMTHSCEIDGDTAHAETYYMFVACLGEDSNVIAGGRYIDRLDRREGEWRLTMRNNFIEWSSVVPAAPNPLGEIVDLHLNGLPSTDSSDPSYQRPLVNRRARNIPGGS